MVDQLSIEYIKNMISPGIVLAFQTTERFSDIATNIVQLLSTLKGYNIKIIECYVNEPIFRRIPKGCEHIEVMSLECSDDEMMNWDLDPLSIS